MSPVMAKLLEYILLEIYEDQLTSDPLQFGFKKHSYCVYLLTELPMTGQDLHLAIAEQDIAALQRILATKCVVTFRVAVSSSQDATQCKALLAKYR